MRLTRTLYLLVSEDLVSEGVEAHEGDPDVGGRHPVLQLLAVVEVVRTWGRKEVM